jgi:signal transduction histidine kinase
MTPTRLFQRFYLLLLGALLLYLILGMLVRHGWTELGMLGGTTALIVLAMLISAAAYPVARRVGARLDRLGDAVRAFGAGDLARRATVEGRDEVAALAIGFNEAAARVETLLGAHRQLLANASHELRTPLARIRLGVELLAERDDPRRRSELIGDLRELDELLDEILLSSRLESSLPLQLEADVDVLGIVAEEVSRYADDGIVLATIPLGSPAHGVRADARLLRRLVRNLLDNARRHGAPPIHVEVVATAGHVELIVDDAGHGIDEADRQRVFEPFYRSRAHAENIGSGLGLALVRQIAERHGGRVDCDRGAHGGARFRVELPKSVPARVT